LGKGGMGEVFEAHDLALHERVALKTVTATQCDSAEAVRLLKAEVQLARRISHPNVCRIFDLGTHSIESPRNEISFLVMEYVDGECLGKKLRQCGALPLDLAQSIAHQLLLGLAAAHGAGVVHRDLKSDNVMLHRQSSGKVKAVILDFGLAKVLSENGSIVTTHSHQFESMIGTIGYMAPEQIEGFPVTAASDIYALGVVWFEMLTGRLPFEAETLAASAMSRLYRLPKPPSHYKDRVPKWLDVIVLRCLGRFPSTRYASAEQVIDALAANTELPPLSPRSSKRRTRIGLRLGIALLTLGVLPPVLAATSQITLWHPNVTHAKPRAAETPHVVPYDKVHESKEPDMAIRSSGVVRPRADPEVPKARPHRSYRPRRWPPSAVVSTAKSEPVAEKAVVEPAPEPTDDVTTRPRPDWLPPSRKPKFSEAQLNTY
jgi:serine/threonine protein kinase